MKLAELGWNDFFAKAFAVHEKDGLRPARVAVQHRGGYKILGQEGECPAAIAGRLRHRARTASELPVVGDWVAAELRPGAKATIHDVLPRRTKLSRTTVGGVTEEQVLSANVDEVFVLAALSGEINPRKIQRYLTVVWEGGALPVLLLAKSDLCQDIDHALLAAKGSAGTAPVLAISTVSGAGLEQVQSRLTPGKTIALIGPSGVGKSTLINALCGEEIQAAQEVRESDGKGRHTTTRRELIQLPAGALMIDTPGLRELQLWEGDGGIEQAFSDIAELAAQCRFADCQHETEPDCAVLRAVEAGLLDRPRLESHRKLQQEQRHFERRQQVRGRLEEKRRGKLGAKLMRTYSKNQNE